MKHITRMPGSFLRCSLFLLLGILIMSKGWSQTAFSKLNDWMNENTKNMGGRSILVVSQDGNVIYTRSINEMNAREKSMNKYVAKKQHLDDELNDFNLDSRQMMASCSKWLSAALIMTFIDDGSLHLSDTVGLFLPILTQHGKGNITISDCLSHLTGIQAPPLKASLREYKNIGSMSEAIQKIAALPMEGRPGKVFHYSNVGLQIAAAVIETISKQSFEVLFAKRIATPLDMKSTDFGHHSVSLPAGGAISTPGDYIHFLTMITNKGEYKGKRILSEQSVNAMQENRITSEVRIAYSPAGAIPFGYGYGEWILGDSADSLQKPWVTSPGLFGSFPWINKEKRYCAVLMTFYLKNKGRLERYKELKNLVDEAIADR